MAKRLTKLVFKNLKAGTGPVVDGIPIKLFKNLLIIFMLIIVCLCNSIYKVM